jgi:hypothetical protein
MTDVDQSVRDATFKKLRAKLENKVCVTNSIASYARLTDNNHM